MIRKGTKVFPCDCGDEGLVARCCGDYLSVNEDEYQADCYGAPYFSISFWKHLTNMAGGNKLTRWERVKGAWAILRGKDDYWADMVCFNAEVAKSFANHLLYLIEKHTKKEPEQEMLVKDEPGDCSLCKNTGKPCSSCGEYHPDTSMCPPHEVRMKFAKDICPQCNRSGEEDDK